MSTFVLALLFLVLLIIVTGLLEGRIIRNKKLLEVQEKATIKSLKLLDENITSLNITLHRKSEANRQNNLQISNTIRTIQEKLRVVHNDNIQGVAERNIDLSIELDELRKKVTALSKRTSIKRYKK